jgi:hypothetical protein
MSMAKGIFWELEDVGKRRKEARGRKSSALALSGGVSSVGVKSATATAGLQCRIRGDQLNARPEFALLGQGHQLEKRWKNSSRTRILLRITTLFQTLRLAVKLREGIKSIYPWAEGRVSNWSNWYYANILLLFGYHIFVLITHAGVLHSHTVVRALSASKAIKPSLVLDVAYDGTFLPKLRRAWRKPHRLQPFEPFEPFESNERDVGVSVPCVCTADSHHASTVRRTYSIRANRSSSI